MAGLYLAWLKDALTLPVMAFDCHWVFDSMKEKSKEARETVIVLDEVRLLAPEELK